MSVSDGTGVFPADDIQWNKNGQYDYGHGEEDLQAHCQESNEKVSIHAGFMQDLMIFRGVEDRTKPFQGIVWRWFDAMFKRY